MRLRLKKSVKRFLLFSSIIIIIIILLVMCFFKNSSKETSKTNDNKKLTATEIVEKKCKKIKYCNKKNINRYVKYYKNNKTLSIEDVIVRVNLNLDYSFYTHTKKATNLNKEYLLVNKYFYLTEDYVPQNLEEISEKYARSGMKLVNVARENFEEMAESAEKDGYTIIAMSSYRSYEYQDNLYNRYVKSDGVEIADTYSGRPGYSEHQTGLCVDIYDGELDYTNFEKSKSFEWMSNNAYKFGFILRFPEGKENITGYQYESWHYRYVGKKIAKIIHENNSTLEEYYAKYIGIKE